MNSLRAVVLPLALSFGALSLLAFGEAPASAKEDTAALCIRVKPEARYRGLGYNHIVHVANVCGSAAECDVSTDVNPTPQHISLPPGGQTEVTTFLGSPARVFTPNVACTMRAP